MVTIRFSSAIKIATNGERKRELIGKTTVNEILAELQLIYGDDFSRRVFENGKPRQYLNFYVNGKDIRFLEKFETKLVDSDILDIIPAVAGG